MASFEDLEVWKRAVRLSVELYKELGDVRDFSYRDQITKAGLSVPSNIAEAMERESRADKTRILTIAKASCGEVRTQIYIGIEIGCIDKRLGIKWVQETREISAMLVGLILSIRRGT